MADAALGAGKPRGKILSRKARNGEPRAFFDKMMMVDTDDCIVWPYSRNSSGYGRICSDLVHRMACEEENGPPPSDRHEAAHKPECHNPACFNRRHVYWATPSQNQMDRIANGTSNRGGRYRNSKLKEADVRKIRKLLSMGMLHREIADQYKIARTVITRIGNRTRWGWVE